MPIIAKMGGRHALLIIFLILLIWIFISAGSIFYEHYDKLPYLVYADREYLADHPGTEVKVALVTGVHGNETAGPHAFMDMINDDTFVKLVKGTPIILTVVPCVNRWGFHYNMRWQPSLWHPDINRAFKETDNDETSKKVIKILEGADFVMDFHEGWGYHRIQPQSIGSTLSPSTSLTMDMAKHIALVLNADIPEVPKKFMVLDRDACQLPGALSCYMERHKRHYILMETTGQMNAQPMIIRKKQVRTAVQELFGLIKQSNIVSQKNKLEQLC